MTALRLAIPFLALLCTPAFAEPTVYMEATGTVTAAPDLATISVGVSAKAETPEATIAASAATVNALLTMLSESGIAARDMQTTSYQFGADTARPNYNNPEGEYLPQEKVIGYHLDNTVRVKVRDIDTVGALIGKIIRIGATSIDNIGFSVEDATPLYDQARAKAFARAQVKAEIYAKAAGRQLGDLSYIREGVGFDTEKMVQIAYPYDEGAADLGVVTSVAAGELGFSVSVTSVWALGGLLN